MRGPRLVWALLHLLLLLLRLLLLLLLLPLIWWVQTCLDALALAPALVLALALPAEIGIFLRGKENDSD